MRAFLIGVAVAIGISVVAALALTGLDMSASDVYQAPANVRL